MSPQVIPKSTWRWGDHISSKEVPFVLVPEEMCTDGIDEIVRQKKYDAAPADMANPSITHITYGLASPRQGGQQT